MADLYTQSRAKGAWQNKSPKLGQNEFWNNFVRQQIMYYVELRSTSLLKLEIFCIGLCWNKNMHSYFLRIIQIVLLSSIFKVIKLCMIPDILKVKVDLVCLGARGGRYHNLKEVVSMLFIFQTIWSSLEGSYFVY